MPILLTEDDVRKLLTMADLVPAMADALVQFSSGAVEQPLRTVFEVGAEGAFFGVMPGYVPSAHALGTKLVSVFAGNHSRGLPSHLATILLFDEQTGALQAVMDGRLITEARTAAVSALSIRLLARHTRNVHLALLGTGVQARSHVEAALAVATVERVTAWSPDATRRAQFAEDMGRAHGFAVSACESARQAVEGADIVVLATSSATPVVDDRWVRDGAHVVSVGACRPDQREMDPALVARARLFVDSREAALAESGDVVQGLAAGRFTADHIRGELGELAAGTIGGRQSEDEVTIFKSLGLAVEDVTAAGLTYRRALAAGSGTRFQL